MTDPFSGKIHKLYEEQHLPSHDDLFRTADRASSVLENEDASYRPYAADGVPGSLLDFTSSPRLPLVVVPDLHARVYFLLNVLDFIPPAGFLDPALDGKTVLEALEEGAVRVVCVGDALHAELRAKDRWLEALGDYLNGIYDGKPMRAEMEEGLTLLEVIMECKCRFPSTFHFLKGNHENIMNRSGGGDYPFRKFANEGDMTAQFMERVYGDDVLHAVSCFEHLLPLAAAFPGCVVSHAEPRRAFSRDEIINAVDCEDVVAGLTWTENDAAEEGSVKSVLVSLLGAEGASRAVYIAGHRPVPGTYALRQHGKFIQIHNTEMQNVALVSPRTMFDPEKDIVSVVKD